MLLLGTWQATPPRSCAWKSTLLNPILCSFEASLLPLSSLSLSLSLPSPSPLLLPLLTCRSKTLHKQNKNHNHNHNHSHNGSL